MSMGKSSASASDWLSSRSAPGTSLLSLLLPLDLLLPLISVLLIVLLDPFFLLRVAGEDLVIVCRNFLLDVC